MAAGPLSNVRILDLGQFIAGPCTSVVLAEMGAEVLKVEPPHGDAFRGHDQGDYSASFVAFNRGKRSVTLDLKTEDGRHHLLELARDVDVIIENFRPGVTDRLGVSYADIRKVNERIIYCTLTGFGSTGPHSTMPAFDGVALGYSGLAHLLLDPDDPRLMGPALADALAGHTAAFHILSGLWERESSGQGHHLELSMLGSLVHFLHSAVSKRIIEEREEGPFTRAHGSQAYAFVASDGKPLLIHLSSPEKFWLGLCGAVERSDLAADPRFIRHADRRRNYDELRPILQKAFGRRPRAEWLKRLQAASVPCAPVNSVGEALQDVQVRHLGIVSPRTDPEAGIGPDIRPPAHWDGSLLPPIVRAPFLGEHNDVLWPHDHTSATGDGS